MKTPAQSCYSGSRGLLRRGLLFQDAEHRFGYNASYHPGETLCAPLDTGKLGLSAVLILGCLLELFVRRRIRSSVNISIDEW